MAASCTGKGASRINYFITKSSYKRPIMSLNTRSIENKVRLAVNVMGKRHFFNSVKAAVSYYYDVLLHTGNRFGAGTDANIFLELYGERGASGEIAIPTKKNELERGMVNKYKVASKDLGILKKVSVRHDNTGMAPAWYLEKVTIKDHSGSRYVFNCGKWLQQKSGEDMLQANLALSEQIIDQVSSYRGKSMEYLKLNEKEHLDAVEETVHENLTSVLQGMIDSQPEEDTHFSMSSDSVAGDANHGIASSLQLAPMLPASRLLVEAFGLMTKQIPATGPKGHLLKGDVLKYIESNKVPRLELQTANASLVTEKVKQADTKKVAKAEVKKPPKEIRIESGIGEFEDVSLGEIGTLSASLYLNAKNSIPHFYTSTKCNLNNALAACKEWLNEGISISTAAFVMKAVSASLRLVPQMNIQNVDGNITTRQTTDITATLHTNDGTYTGVVGNVNEKNLQDIEHSMQEIKTQNTADINSNRGACTVVDLSSVGVSHFAEIIRPSQAFILTIGTPKLSLSENDSLVNSSTITLSCDGSLIAEDTASRFLEVFKKIIENPSAYM